MQIEQLERVTAEGKTERLPFAPGLNTLVGRPNTGKTVWLTMLDYVLGDRSPIEHALFADLANKYSIIRAVLRLEGGVETVIERRWKEPGSNIRCMLTTARCPLTTSPLTSCPSSGSPSCTFRRATHIRPELGPSFFGVACSDTYFDVRILVGVAL